MTDPSYRLETDQGLSKKYSVTRLREKLAAGVVDATARCTIDDGQTWVHLSELIEEGGADVPRDSSSVPNPVNSESASIAQSETTVDFTNESEDEADMSLRSQSRKLRRLPAGSGNGKLAKLRAARDQKKAAGTIGSPDDLIGVQLASDRYKIVDKLGKGSMAYVLRASDSRLLTDVVVKVPKPEKMIDPDIRDRFRRESQLLVQLTHPHVVKVLDVGEYCDLPYVVMQYLSGGTLTEKIQEESDGTKGMTPDSLKSWLREVARALDFCYRKGMVHRDVKPANILFDEDSNAYVSDFGLTKIMYGDHDNIDPSDTASGVVLGTPNYISPEVVLGREYDGRADQYSLGITVYHALYGKAPMQGHNATATMINQTQKQLQLLSDFRSDVPRELALAVRKSIEKDPEKRFSSCEEFADAVIEGLRAPVGKTGAIPVVSTAWADGDSSSQSSVRRKRSKKKNRSARSGRMDSVPTPATPDADVDWLDIASEPAADALPRRKGKSKSSRTKKTKKNTTGTTVIFGQEVHPALVLTLGIGMIALVLSIIIRWAISDDGIPDDLSDRAYDNSNPDQVDPEARPVDSIPQLEAKNGGRNQGNGNQNGGRKSNGSPAGAGKAKRNAAPIPSTDIPAVSDPEAMANDSSGIQQAGYSSGVTPSPKGKVGSDKSNTKTDQEIAARDINADATANAAVSPKQKKTVADTAGTTGKDLTSKSSIPFTAGDRITSGLPGCPVLVVGSRVWNKAANSIAATLEGSYPQQAQTALSADGKYFAAATKVPDQQNSDVVVWDAGTGKRLFTAKGTIGQYADALLLSNKFLFVGGRSSTDLKRWNCDKGNEGKAIPLSQAAFHAANTAISNDGMVIATVSNAILGVVSTENGKIRGTMRSPGAKPRISQRSSAGDNRPDTGNQDVYESLQSLSFANDNTALAALATHPVPRIMCWSGSDGGLTMDRAIPGSFDTDKDNRIQWFPDGNAWLVGGQVIDRETGHVLTTLKNSSARNVCVYDQTRLCGEFPGSNGLTIKEVPWDQIQSSVAALNNAAVAHVSPASPVSLQVSLNGRTDLEGHVTRAFTRRLSADGIRVEGTNNSATFVVTGDFVTRTLSITMKINGETEWTDRIDEVKAMQAEFASSDSSARKPHLDMITAEIGQLVVPYFVPKSDDLATLPVVLK